MAVYQLYTGVTLVDHRPVCLLLNRVHCICFTRVGTSDAVTSALHIIVGESTTMRSISELDSIYFQHCTR